MRILYALTGPPGCGKTTAILKIVDELKRRNIKVEGMYTQELRESGRRVGFAVKRISGGEGILAHIKFKEGPRLGKYVVNLRDLESIGVSALLDGLGEADVVVVDEVGPMELFSGKFREAVEELLSSSKNAVITVHYRSRDPLVVKVKEAAGKNLVLITPENRDRAPSMIVKSITEAVEKR
ncbi:MAG: NTPase [Aigarchaeota archaeon]|nr:NTPase [Aigarchaeota archaeon]